MKSLNNISKLSLLALSLIVTFAACSAVNNDVESLTDEDIQLATQVIAESVSDETSGIMSSFYDAVSSVGNDGIDYQEGNQKATNDENSGRGSESSFSYSYDSETGMHTLEYDRSVTNGEFSKGVSLTNTYIFESPEGDFIVRPRANADSIESVDFTGSIDGFVNSRRKNSEFARLDTFAIAGLHSTSSIVSIDGTHYGVGYTSGQNADSVQFAANFTVGIEFADVRIDKQIVETNGNLEEGVTGTLSYSVELNRSFGSRSETKVIQGTIEMDGDGTALLRFNKAIKTIRFSLKDGSREG